MSSTSLAIGFLSIFQEANGTQGGYLVTNNWGRPLEFRLTSAVQPNKVQQILYADTLQTYLHADLIGKTLVEKTGVPVELVIVDRELALELRPRLTIPVVWLPNADEPRLAEFLARGLAVQDVGKRRASVLCHPAHAADVPLVSDLTARIDPAFDLAEPFQRIREAVSEARKLGVSRAA